ncbi:MAG: HD domain-containing protein [Planctomycetaceae bacterium]|jgi:(p)ppGpp synthase/HD superfamily hydrolase|nr:HD domain-containing protein [Planctomycetaceae bacterium]
MTDRFTEAVKLAKDLHSGQTRKDSDGSRFIPYLSHLLRVAGLVMGFGGDEDTVIAALLHDAVEDQGGMATAEVVRSSFGERVTKFVLDCSDSFSRKGEKKLPWRQRKEAYIAHLHAAESESRLICACDKLDNLRCIVADYRLNGEELWKIFSGGRDGTLWYYHEVYHVLCKNGNPVLFDELKFLLEILEKRVAENQNNE